MSHGAPRRSLLVASRRLCAHVRTEGGRPCCINSTCEQRVHEMPLHSNRGKTIRHLSIRRDQRRFEKDQLARVQRPRRNTVGTSRRGASYLEGLHEIGVLRPAAAASVSSFGRSCTLVSGGLSRGPPPLRVVCVGRVVCAAITAGTGTGTGTTGTGTGVPVPAPLLLSVNYCTCAGPCSANNSNNLEHAPLAVYTHARSLHFSTSTSKQRVQTQCGARQ